MSEIQANKLSPASGTALQVGDSGDVITIPSGATITNSGTATGFGGDNTPSFRARLSSDQSIPYNTTTKLALATEDWDTDSAWNTSNYNFTVPSGEGGKYYFMGHIRLLSTWGHDSNIHFTNLVIKKNNTDISVNRIYDFSASTKDLFIYVEKIEQCSAGDVIDLHVFQDSANSGAKNVGQDGAATFFTGYKLNGV